MEVLAKLKELVIQGKDTEATEPVSYTHLTLPTN